MGVIKKTDPKLGLFASASEESLHIPQQSEDDDDDVTSGTTESVLLPSVINGSHRHRQRVRPIPTTFNNPKKQIGKKRNRRYENGRQLETLVEDEELQELNIYDFVRNPCASFSMLLEDEDALQLWNQFNNCSEEQQYQVINSRRNISQKAQQQRTVPLTGENAFKNIKGGLRSKLKKCRVPLGMISHLENKVVDFFIGSPAKVFISEHVTSFERLLLHAVAQYHGLRSASFDSEPENLRLVKISNPMGIFQPSSVLLVKFLDEKRKDVNH